MKPVNLKFKGLGSYFGESEINFGSLDDVFLICGETGSGKTTILDAMMFALYGESSGGERSELLNGHYTKKTARLILSLNLSCRASGTAFHGHLRPKPVPRAGTSIRTAHFTTRKRKCGSRILIIPARKT